MQFKARVIDRLPMQSGTSRSGNDWSKATLIVESISQYPKKVAISNMKRADEFNSLPAGTVATFDVEMESREFNGRWYTDVTCWNWTIEYTQQPLP